MSYGPLVPQGGATSMQQMVGMVAATTDITSLVKTVTEAYCLTVSLERDMAAIEAHYRHLEQTDRQLHDEIMLALEGGFARQEIQIAFIERMAGQLIERDQYEVAHSIISQMMKLLEKSPVQEAFSRRQP